MQSFKNYAVGAASGLLTYFASICTIGYTSAFAMPRDFPVSLWVTVVVFGLGGTLVAALVHLVALRAFSAKTVSAFVSFVATVVLALAVAGQVFSGFQALVAWLAGALLASVLHSRLRPNNSFKPNPHQGGA